MKLQTFNFGTNEDDFIEKLTELTKEMKNTDETVLDDMFFGNPTKMNVSDLIFTCKI